MICLEIFALGAVLSFMESPAPPLFQDTLLENFFRDCDLSSLQAYTHGFPPHRICQWTSDFYRDCRAFECTNGSLEILKIVMQRNIGPVQFHFIPPTVKVLDLSGCGQEFLLETRYFPKSAQSIALASNFLYGTPELAALPKNLELLELANNILTGPIHLFHLPETLKILSLRENHIKQKILYYGDLPKPIQRIDIQGNVIGAIKCVTGNPRLVFPGTPVDQMR